MLPLLVVLLLGSPAAASAADSAPAKGEASPAVSIALSGLVEQPQTLTLAALRAFPAQHVSVTYMTGRGEQKGTYTGARLWDVLQAAKVVQQGRMSNMKRSIVIEAKDGYSILMSLAELDPDYGNDGALIAYAREDAKQDGVRLIVPGDKHGGRAVDDVTKIEVK
jgi:hypothetical protein